MKKKAKKKAVCDIPTARFTVELAENRQLFICGCTGIASYSETEVRLNTRADTVEIAGSDLSLAWAGEGKLLLTGTVRTITFS